MVVHSECFIYLWLGGGDPCHAFLGLSPVFGGVTERQVSGRDRTEAGAGFWNKKVNLVAVCLGGYECFVPLALYGSPSVALKEIEMFEPFYFLLVLRRVLAWCRL